MALRVHLRQLWRQLRSEARLRDWRGPLRPWSDFFARLGRPPTDVAALRDRVLLNSHVFQTNYVVLLGGACLALMLRTPSSLFVAAALAALFAFVTATRPLLVGSTRVTLPQRRAVAAAAAVVLLISSGLLLSLIACISVTVLLLLMHASCRRASSRHKLSDIRSHISDAW